MAYYTRTYNPQPTTRVASTDLKNEFQAVENGLASAETADGKAIRAPEATTALPSAASRALKVLSFDGSGNPRTTIAETDLAAAVTAAGNAAASASNAAASKTAAAASAVAADASAIAAAASAASIAGGPVTSVNGMTGIVTLALIASYEYDNRAALRSLSPANGDAAVVKGLGMFLWESGSTEPDDDESCFATASGCWLLAAAGWDLVDAWQAPDQQVLADDDEDESLRFASKVITTTFTNTVSSVGPSVTTKQNVPVIGAVVGAAVIVTRSAESGTKPEGVVYGIVTSPNTVTVHYATPDNAQTTYYATSGTWRVTVINP